MWIFRLLENSIDGRAVPLDNAAMFSDLYDAISFFWSWRWPTAHGEVTEAIVERIPQSRGEDRYRLAVAYEFSIGEDGPYTGESFWDPIIWFCPKRRVLEARRRFRRGTPVLVRYRADDPSVNSLDRSVWRKR